MALARGAAVALNGAAAGLLFMFGIAADAQARTRCAYTGAPTNVLTVTATGASMGEIKRAGQEIVVGEFRERPRPCTGGVPTVLNTDTIKVLFRDGDPFVNLRLGGGAFAPGATPEAEGVAEIEVEFSGPDAYGTVTGTSRADEFHWGRTVAEPGLNLNPRLAGDQDVDVTVTRGFGAFLVADGGGGNDTIIPTPDAVGEDLVFSEGGRGHDRLTAPRTGGSLDGGSGNDVITGGRSLDFLDGGAGNDRLDGGRGDDVLRGGRGRDVLVGGRGRDRVNARDSRRDRVRCGAGRDRVVADRRDRLRGCEVVSRR